MAVSYTHLDVYKRQVHALLAGDLAVAFAEDQVSVHPAALDLSLIHISPPAR